MAGKLPWQHPNPRWPPGPIPIGDGEPRWPPAAAILDCGQGHLGHLSQWLSHNLLDLICMTAAILATSANGSATTLMAILDLICITAAILAILFLPYPTHVGHLGVLVAILIPIKEQGAGGHLVYCPYSCGRPSCFLSLQLVAILAGDPVARLKVIWRPSWPGRHLEGNPVAILKVFWWPS
ncbi:hypothetical protein HGM15179_017991 [Zosterops borbonicus]|uniref:Uncharacterized protein n=1 Tax=Zosterops borbonicus TaxID=364589 RepID=A0A8K1FZV4_9PASS|nr:hypothetical protein HGM15179_017991 [Zosterops borbonicus]